MRASNSPSSQRAPDQGKCDRWTGEPGVRYSPHLGGRGADVACDAFATQADAQNYYLGQVGDPDGLDRDGDGLACESLP